jgi:hypothetical protein
MTTDFRYLNVEGVCLFNGPKSIQSASNTGESTTRKYVSPRSSGAVGPITKQSLSGKDNDLVACCCIGGFGQPRHGCCRELLPAQVIGAKVLGNLLRLPWQSNECTQPDSSRNSPWIWRAKRPSAKVTRSAAARKHLRRCFRGGFSLIGGGCKRHPH